jgi:hypothetical protein
LSTPQWGVSNREMSPESRVALSVADQNNMYDKVVIHGRVTSQTLEGADAHIDKLAKKYIGKDKYPWRAPGERRVIIKMEPTQVLD